MSSLKSSLLIENGDAALGSATAIGLAAESDVGFGCRLGFRVGDHAGAVSLGWTEYEIPLSSWPDSNHTVRFVALAKEQLALITHDGSHGISFLWDLGFTICDLRKINGSTFGA
jgi:hypothetical protein